MKTLLDIQKETAKEFRVHNARFAPFSLRIASEIRKRIDELKLQNENNPGDINLSARCRENNSAIKKEWESFLGELNAPENVLKISIEIKQNEG